MSHPFRTFLDLRNVPNDEQYPRLRSRVRSLSHNEQLVIINASHPEPLFDRLFRETSDPEVNYGYRAYTVLPDVYVGILNRGDQGSRNPGYTKPMERPLSGSSTVVDS